MAEKVVLRPDIQGLDCKEKYDCVQRVSMSDPQHLKSWLRETGRRWLIFDALELVDSLPFPGGVDSLIQLIACYRDHRRAIVTGRIESLLDPTLGVPVEVPVAKGENLELDEMEQVVRYLIRQIVERDPAWRLDTASR